MIELDVLRFPRKCAACRQMAEFQITIMDENELQALCLCNVHLASLITQADMLLDEFRGQWGSPWQRLKRRFRSG